jgi:hypothetical protein
MAGLSLCQHKIFLCYNACNTCGKLVGRSTDVMGRSAKLMAAFLCMGLSCSSLFGCGAAPGGELSTATEVSVDKLVFEDGMAQPILTNTNLTDENYTNEGSDILRYCVYV